MENIMVSVICIAYNHEKYIRDAIEGCLMQEVNFNYEILIHDDVSTDRTAEIIRSYEERYPGLVIGVYEKENQYSQGKRITESALNRSRGKYIAYCEGDDYWTDKHKLQTQVDFMETHPEYSLVAHGAKQLNLMNGKESLIRCRVGDGEIILRDVIVQPYGNFPTASLMMRREVCFAEDFFWDTGIEDWPLQISAIIYGKVFYMDKTMSVYRHGVEGSWTARNDSKNPGKFKLIQYLKLLRLTDRYDDYTGYKYHEYVSNQRDQFYTSVVLKYLYCDGYQKLCDYCDEIMPQDEKYAEYCQTIQKFLFGLMNKTYRRDEIRQFASRFENILIYGAGEYAGILADLLEDNKINYNGFIVTFLNGSDSYRDKTVWEIGKIPFPAESTGVLLGTGQNLYYVLKNNLEANQMKHYYAPFLNIS